MLVPVCCWCRRRIVDTDAPACPTCGRDPREGPPPARPAPDFRGLLAEWRQEFVGRTPPPARADGWHPADVYGVYV